MDEAGLRFLLSPAGQAVLAEYADRPLTADSHLALASALRERLEPGQAQAVVETLILRERAAGKFSHAAEMLFTRDGLEQATAEPVARHRAERYRAAGVASVAELGCGIGGDAVALAAVAPVVAVDLSRLRLALARHNAAVYGVAARFLPVQADLLAMPPLPAGAFFFDPARRTGGGPRAAPSRRLHSVDDYRPPLSLIDAWLPVVPHGAVKVSPGIDYAEIPPAAEVEFVSLDGEVKEGVLWYGDLRSGAGRRATLLPGGHTIDSAAGEAEDVAVTPPAAYLYEPDGAVIRAHLVRPLAAGLGATLIDAEIAYLTADKARPTPFARAYELEAAFPFQLKALRSYLRERGVGRVTIKKRGSPLDPDEVRRALRLRGDAERVVFLTRAEGRPIVLVGREATAA